MIARVFVGDSFRQTWVNSGTTPSSIFSSVLDGAETIVSSGAMISSGNGHFYRFATINTPGFYVSRTEADISTETFIRRTAFQVIAGEVD